MHQVRRWMGLAHQSNKEDFQAAPSISRRGLLKAGGYGALSLAGVGALAGKVNAFASKPKIAIVGAGIAGLNAAWKLKKAGVPSTIYEASGRAGGRIWTAKDVMGPGITTEIGGEFIDSGHTEMLALAQEFHLNLIDFQGPTETGLKETYFFGGKARTEAEIVKAFGPIAKSIAADQDAIVFDDYSSYNQLALRLDRTPLDVYLRQKGASGWIFNLLNVAYTTEFGLDTHLQSALNFIFLVGTDLTNGFSEFGESDQRYRILGGNELLTQELGAKLHSQIQLGHALVAIQACGTGFELHFEGPNTHCQQVYADIVLLTLPFSTLRDVHLEVALPSNVKRGIREIGYGTNAKLVLGYKRRYWRQAGRSGLFFTEEPIQSGWDSSQLQPGDSAALTLFLGGKNGLDVAFGTPEFQAAKARPSVEKMFPGGKAFTNSRAFRFNWPNYAWSKGSYTCFTPGQYTQYSGLYNQPFGTLYFAGEHCSFDSQGYMNGGAQTGADAAAAILTAIGV